MGPIKERASAFFAGGAAVCLTNDIDLLVVFRVPAHFVLDGVGVGVVVSYLFSTAAALHGAGERHIVRLNLGLQLIGPSGIWLRR